MTGTARSRTVVAALTFMTVRLRSLQLPDSCRCRTADVNGARRA